MKPLLISRGGQHVISSFGIEHAKERELWQAILIMAQKAKLSLIFEGEKRDIARYESLSQTYFSGGDPWILRLGYIPPSDEYVWSGIVLCLGEVLRYFEGLNPIAQGDRGILSEHSPFEFRVGLVMGTGSDQPIVQFPDPPDINKAGVRKILDVSGISCLKHLNEARPDDVDIVEGGFDPYIVADELCQAYAQMCG